MLKNVNTKAITLSTHHVVVNTESLWQDSSEENYMRSLLTKSRKGLSIKITHQVETRKKSIGILGVSNLPLSEQCSNVLFKSVTNITGSLKWMHRKLRIIKIR
jgi:hypothetical protein